MTDLVTLVREAANATGRPDQEIWAFTAADAIIREICRSADYAEDLYETFYPLADPLELVTAGRIALPSAVDYSPEGGATLDNWSVRKLSHVMYGQTQLTRLAPQQLFRGGCQELDVYYLTGGNFLSFNASTPLDTLFLGAYLYPPHYTADQHDQPHWTLDAAPDIITYGTMAKIYKNVGDDGSHDRFYQEYQRLLRQFKLDQVGEGVI